jgi:cytochrome c
LTSAKAGRNGAGQPRLSAGSELGASRGRIVEPRTGEKDMTMRRLTVGILAGALALSGTAALAQGDPESGEKVFNKCKVCHVADEEKNKVGPTLLGVFGRPAGSVEGFNYSDAMKESGITWDEATLAAYVADPKGYIPGNKMAFPGLRKEEDIADLIAYLKEVTAQ